MNIKILVKANMIITLFVFIGNYFYQSLGFNYTLKIMCSSGFALMGIMNMIYANKTVKDKRVLLFMVLGLVFAFLGDVAINPNFILGVIFFAFGHVFFVASYLEYRRLNKLDVMLCVGLGVFSVGFTLLFPYIIFEVQVLKYVVLIYAVIISVMVGKSVGNAIHEGNVLTEMVALGSILFFISDMMLLLAWFSTIEGRWTSNVCMAAYYPALCLLAGSMVLYINKNEKSTDCGEDVIARIKQMEKYFDIVQDKKELYDDVEIRKMIETLKNYQESGQWLKDFECEEQGMLPIDLKRGVLSEDGLYNLLYEVEHLSTSK